MLRNGRRLIPEGLPEEVIEYELPEEDRVCPVDGQPMPRIRWEQSKQLDYVPAQMNVIVHRAVYACPAKHDEARLVTAAKPPQPIEKGLAAAGLLAQVVVSKFGDHLPATRDRNSPEHDLRLPGRCGRSLSAPLPANEKGGA